MHYGVRECLTPDRERHPTRPRSNPVLSPAPPRVENRMRTRMTCLADIQHGIWDLVSRGIPGHRLYISDVTFTDLCICIISSQPLWRRSSVCYRRDEQPARGCQDIPRGRWVMPTAVIDSLRTDASATHGAEVTSASCSTWWSARRQTLGKACRRRRRRIGSFSDSTPSRTASFYGMLVASDISRHAPSVPS
jgi:hypothetical protein